MPLEVGPEGLNTALIAPTTFASWTSWQETHEPSSTTLKWALGNFPGFFSEIVSFENMLPPTPKAPNIATIITNADTQSL